MPAHEAPAAAQLKMESKRYDPFYWSVFVMVGKAVKKFLLFHPHFFATGQQSGNQVQLLTVICEN